MVINLQSLPANAILDAELNSALISSLKASRYWIVYPQRKKGSSSSSSLSTLQHVNQKVVIRVLINTHIDMLLYIYIYTVYYIGYRLQPYDSTTIDNTNSQY